MGDPTDKPRKRPSPEAAPRMIRSSDLLQGERQIVIEHEGELYRLQLTRNGRLILQK